MISDSYWGCNWFRTNGNGFEYSKFDNNDMQKAIQIALTQLSQDERKSKGNGVY